MKRQKLWIFDFDGTLAAGSHNYHAARLDPACEDMLIMLVEKVCGRVAVMSSRHLFDLDSRIHVPGICLGGSSGLAWQLPGGETRTYQAFFESDRSRVRDMLLPRLRELEVLYGFDTEDKVASVVLHASRLQHNRQQDVFAEARNLAREHACEVFCGPESIEIYFMPAPARVAAIAHLCSMLALDPDAAEITCAGDDAHDVPVMQWVLQHGGRVYTVGNTPLVAGGHVVKSPAQLAREITRLCAGPDSA